jgi:hypothetical protein
MSIAYTWGFPQVEISPSLDGLEKVVRTVHWTLTATDGDYSASCYGSVGLDAPVAEDFTLFDDISKAQMEEWITAKIDTGRTKINDMKNGLAGNIESQKTPKTISMKPPFA